MEGKIIMKKSYRFTRLMVFLLIIIVNQIFLRAQVRYKVIDLGISSGVATAINDSGQIVGEGFISGIYGGFFWEDNNIIPMGKFLGPTAINNLGQVVGEYALKNENDTFIERAFLWQSGNFTNLDPGDQFSIATDINDNEVAVGFNNRNNVVIAVRWKNNSLQDIGIPVGSEAYQEARAINNSDQIVGYLHCDCPSPDGTGSFLWDNGSITRINDLEFISINDSSQILCQTLNPPRHAVLLDNGNRKDLGEFEPTKINNKGEVVGYGTLGNAGNVYLYENSLFNLNNVSDTSGGWVLSVVNDINNKGEIVGFGFHNGERRAFLLEPNSLAITEPIAGELWTAGEMDTIKWEGGEKGKFVDIKYSVDSGKTFHPVATLIPAELGKYAWNMDDTILTTKALIKISDINDTTITNTSDLFKIKPFIITRVDKNGNYVAYDVDKDRWNFPNTQINMWPIDYWYGKFDYKGTDPFTNSEYSQWQGNSIFQNTRNDAFPDWVSFVNAFGIDACYFSRTLRIYNPAALSRWGAIKHIWGGSCFGMAISDALVFEDKKDFASIYSDYPQFNNPIEATPISGVVKVITELFTKQFGNPTVQNHINKINMTTPNQTLDEIKSMLRDDNTKIKTLTIINNNGQGGHEILPYMVERDNSIRSLYYIWVYDNSYPNIKNAIITVDTTGNSNNGIWNVSYAWNNWGGTKGFFLEPTAKQYLNLSALPKSNKNYSPFIMSSSMLEVSNPQNAAVFFRDSLGNTTGFNNNKFHNNIPGCIPLTVIDGSESPPYSYLLPMHNFNMEVSDFSNDTLNIYLFTGNKSFQFFRTDAVQNQKDILNVGNGVSVVNKDNDNKSVSLSEIINEVNQEKLYKISSLELTKGDSIKIENPDSNKIKLVSFGSAKNYDIELNFATEKSLGRFGSLNIPLKENTSHTIIPDWTNLEDKITLVLIDEGNDGTIDDTLILKNELTNIKDKGSLTIPEEFYLSQNYPNPFNPTTTIRYSIPQNSKVTLKVYDILGREVATLVNEAKQPGNYEVAFNGSGLASGIYFYRLQAGNFSATKKLILMK